MSKKPVVLMILDGYGLNDKCEANAVCEGRTPVMDQLMSQCPYVKGQASGLAVGLPDGQMGNSEVGHLNMGAGRIVYQELTRITKSIEDGDFFEVPDVNIGQADLSVCAGAGCAAANHHCAPCERTDSTNRETRPCCLYHFT